LRGDAVRRGRAEAAGEYKEGKNTVFAEHFLRYCRRQERADSEAAKTPSDFGPYRFKSALAAPKRSCYSRIRDEHKKCFGAEENPTRLVQDAFMIT